MQYDNSDDPFGFWDDEPTRALTRTHAGTRSHGEADAATRMIPVVRTKDAQPPAPTRPPRNPLITRIGILIGVMLVFVPIAFSLRSGNTRLEAADVKTPETISIGQLPPAPTELTEAPTTAPTTSVAIVTEAVVVTPAPTEAATVVVETSPPATAAPTSAAAKKKAAPKPAATQAPPPTAAQSAEKAPCALTYTVAKNDAWSTIATRAKVSLKDLLAANGASAGTVLLPGKTICLPTGATVPAAPAAPATTVPAPKPATTQPRPATTQPKPATTQPTPAPTAPPSTQPAPPPNTTSRAQAAQIIRDVWPDDLEDTAIQIATRESNLVPTVHNACCYGLFQIYYSAHQSWLASIGVTSAAQLYDPHVNANAAYALYRISGWGPWGGAPATTTVPAG